MGEGWRLICPLEEITLLDIYLALGAPAIFAIGAASDTQHCLVEKAVNHAIDDVLEQAKQLLLARFGQIKLSQLQNDFQLLREVTVDCRDQLNPD
jgi:DNA-binding IscR family transcriptional regulator